jgi:hypothetical protein
VAPPTGKRAVPVVVAVAPDRRRRLSDAALVEASVAARLLGMRILTLNATVALVPADVTAATHPVRDRPPSEDQAAHVPMRSSGDSRARPGTAKHNLADAVRNLEEGARLLADVQRNAATESQTHAKPRQSTRISAPARHAVCTAVQDFSPHAGHRATH